MTGVGTVTFIGDRLENGGASGDEGSESLFSKMLHTQSAGFVASLFCFADGSK